MVGKPMWRWVSGLVLVGLVAGCGAAADETTANSGAVPPEKLGAAWSPAPAQSGETVYAGVGVRSRPAPVDATPGTGLPQVLAGKEVARFRSLGLAVGEPQTALRVLTSGDFSPDDAGRASFRRERLAWVLTFADSPADLHGPFRGSKGAVERPKLSCQLVLALDAADGSALEEFQDCNPQ